MSFSGLLEHRLALVTPTFAVVGGETVQTGTDVVPVDGLVQPRTAQEIAALTQAGAEISTHVIFLDLRDVAPGTWISDTPAGTGQRYDITGVRRFDYGGSPHLEIDARLVTP
jgi:hypothetical protein